MTRINQLSNAHELIMIRMKIYCIFVKKLFFVFLVRVVVDSKSSVIFIYL